MSKLISAISGKEGEWSHSVPSSMQVKVKRLHQNAKMPLHGSTEAAGFDLYAADMDQDEFGNWVYDTGLAMEIPVGYACFLLSRSSVAGFDLIMSNCVGLIDSDYRGTIKVKFKRTPQYDGRVYQVGDRICQAVILPIPKVEYVEVDELSDTERGTGSYGSTGRK